MAAHISHFTSLYKSLTRGILVHNPLRPAITVIESWQLVLSKGAET
jgi:hypothetical protein